VGVQQRVIFAFPQTNTFTLCLCLCLCFVLFFLFCYRTGFKKLGKHAISKETRSAAVTRNERHYYSCGFRIERYEIRKRADCSSAAAKQPARFDEKFTVSSSMSSIASRLPARLPLLEVHRSWAAGGEEV